MESYHKLPDSPRQERDLRIVKLFQQGVPIIALSERFGLNRQVITRILVSQGAYETDKRRGRRPKPKAEAATP